MKQSKYSKRRPKNGIPYIKSVSTNVVKNIVSAANKIKVKYLDQYDLGIFIDDIREMTDVSLPEAKEWKTFKGFLEYGEWIESLGYLGIDIPKTVFISFDHYLEVVDRGRYNGQDCVNITKLNREYIGEHIDIKGHSSDENKNAQKLDYWYNH